MIATALGRRRIVFLLVVTALVLLTFDQRGNQAIDAVRRATGDLLSPLQDAVRLATRPAVDAWSGITNYRDLERENARLREDLEAAEGAAVAAEVVIYENNELRTNEGLPTLVGIDRVAAEVVSSEPSNFDDSVVINQGARRGIKPGMPVVTGAGVIGRVTSVTEGSSVVRLVTDPESSVSVRFLARDCLTTASSAPTVATAAPEATTVPGAATVPVVVPEPTPPTTLPPIPSTPELLVGRELGLMKGRGSDQTLLVSNVSVEDCIEVGDPVVTSGVAESLFPGGIPVGRVTSVDRTPGSLDLRIEVEPLADLDSLSLVKVLLFDADAAYSGG